MDERTMIAHQPLDRLWREDRQWEEEKRRRRSTSGRPAGTRHPRSPTPTPRQPSGSSSPGLHDSGCTCAACRHHPSHSGPPGLQVIPAMMDDPSRGGEYARWVLRSLNVALRIRLPIEGVLGPAARAAIRTFQRRAGLPADGIVGPPTEAALIRATVDLQATGVRPRARIARPEREIVSSGDVAADRQVDRRNPRYVAWLQRALNANLGAALVVDGRFGPNTQAAVRTFQQRSGLAVDGKPGPLTERALIIAGGEPPLSAALSSSGNTGPQPQISSQLPIPGRGYYRYQPHREQFGLPETIRAIQAIGAVWQDRYPGAPRVGIGDISLQGGGRFGHHKSHQTGLDVDIRPIRRDGAEAGVTWRDAAYSRDLTRRLIDVIRTNGVLRVQYVFFNDPQIGRWPGITVKPWPGHDDHLHVRFLPAGR